MMPSSRKSDQRLTAIVIGGGLVGALCVCLLARRGFEVTLYEKRKDLRHCKSLRGRSINLALSHRGRKALQLIGLENVVLENAIAMKGRLLHIVGNIAESVPYDPATNECIFSIERNLLNSTLLNAAETHENVRLCFDHKLIKANFDDGTITIENTLSKTETFITTADFIVGADGAYSKLRGQMQKTPLFDFSQTFIDHGYLELSIPSERGWKMRPGHLHIWPRGEFMMIALPNRNESWTVTLFMPFEKFRAISTEEKLLRFFRITFPDAVDLIGKDELVKCYFDGPVSPLVSIKCSQYHSGQKFLIIGDAAHAMVPFYGQGMNAGFEDCTLLDRILNETKNDIGETIKIFSRKRRENAHAICDLAFYNYEEMRHLVTKPSFKLRKKLDKFLSVLWPDYWIPLYNSVSFSHMDYSACLANKRWQDKVILLAQVFGAIMATMLLWMCYYYCYYLY